MPGEVRVSTPRSPLVEYPSGSSSFSHGSAISSIPPRMCSPKVWTITPSFGDFDELTEAGEMNASFGAEPAQPPEANLPVIVPLLNVRWLQISTGITKDTLKLVGMGVNVGFGAVRSLTSVFFELGSYALTSTAKFVDRKGPVFAPLSKVLKGLSKSIDFTRRAAVGMIDHSHKATKCALASCGRSLSYLGARDGEALRLFGYFTGKQEVAEAVLAVTTMFSNILSMGDVDASLSDILMAIRTFSKIQMSCRTAKTISGDPVDLDDLPMVGRMINFALGAYGCEHLIDQGSVPKNGDVKTDEAAICYITGIEEADIVASCWKGWIYHPAWYLAIDHQTASIVLVIRGTSNLEDALTDLVCEAVPCKLPALADSDDNPEGRGYAHRGFWTAAQKLTTELYFIVKKATEKHHKYRLILTGHSLGAAVAALMTLMWVPSFPRVHCYAYAEPCILSRELCGAAQSYITALVYGDDMVPRFGLGSALDLRAVILRLAGDRHLRQSDEAEILTRLKQEEMTHHKLFPAGVILYNCPEPKAEEDLPQITYHSSAVSSGSTTSGTSTPTTLAPRNQTPTKLNAPRRNRSFTSKDTETSTPTTACPPVDCQSFSTNPTSPGLTSATGSVRSGGVTFSNVRTVWMVDTYEFEELLLSDSMFSAHFPLTYMNSLQFLPEPTHQSPCETPSILHKLSGSIRDMYSLDEEDYEDDAEVEMAKDVASR